MEEAEEGAVIDVDDGIFSTTDLGGGIRPNLGLGRKALECKA